MFILRNFQVITGGTAAVTSVARPENSIKTDIR